MSGFQSWLVEIDRYLAVVVLGICGGCVRAANDNDPSFRRFVVSAITSGFVSVLISLCLADTEIPFSIKGAIIGLSGYSASATLEILNRFFLSRLEKVAARKEEQRQELKNGDS